jgi:hypothetical protein
MAPPSSTFFWVIGVGVGVIAAGVGTYMFLKRRMVAYREEPLVPLPFPRPDGTAGASRLAGSNHSWRAETATSTSSHDQAPAAGGLDTAEMAASAPELEDLDAEWIGAQANGTSEPDIAAAVVVGNIRTLAYHFSDDANLPDEDNRVYFSSEEEARQAGFHHVTDEITSSENSGAE